MSARWDSTARPHRCCYINILGLESETGQRDVQMETDTFSALASAQHWLYREEVGAGWLLILLSRPALAYVVKVPRGGKSHPYIKHPISLINNCGELEYCRPRAKLS